MITVKAFVVNYFSENTYLVYDETREAILIDCGCVFPEEQKALSNFITETGITLKRYLCTHLHLDHTFGNEFIYNTYSLKPEAHEADVTGLPSLNTQARAFGLLLQFKDIPVEHYLVEGETIPFGHSELKVLAVPGHSPGGLSFYCEKEKFVIVGDSLFAGSVGRTDLWGGSEGILISSVHDKLFSLPNETIVYPGHGPITSIIHEKENNIYLYQ